MSTRPSRTSHYCTALVTSVVLLCGVVPSPAPAQTLPGLRQLFADSAEDFRRLMSKESAVILSVGGAAAAVGHLDDRRLSAAMSSADGLKSAFIAGETVGGARTQAAAAVVVYAMGHMTSNPTVARIGSDLIRAQLVTQTITAAVKTAVGRARPDGTQYSFPSGHAAVTFASATVLQRNLGWKVGVPAYAVATYVATSRIQVKRHFLSDVTFGAAIGIASGRTVTIGRGSHRFALAPTAVPGGGGVSLTWVGRN